MALWTPSSSSWPCSPTTSTATPGQHKKSLLISSSDLLLMLYLLNSIEISANTETAMLLFANFNLKCFSLQFSSIAQLLHNMLSRNFQSIPPEEGKSAPIMKYQKFWLRMCILRMPYLNSMWYNLCIPLNFHNAKLGHFILDRII